MNLPSALTSLLRDPLPYVEPRADEDAGVRRREADPYFSTKLVLAELGGVRAIPGASDALARLLTRPLRRPLPVPLARFFGAWYRLLEAAVPTNPGEFRPERLLGALEEATEASAALGLEELASLLAALSSLSRSEGVGPVRLPSGAMFPEVLYSLRVLNEEVVHAWNACRATPGELARQDHLNKALSALGRVRWMAAESPDVPQPFAAVLGLIVHRWYETVSSERDRLRPGGDLPPLGGTLPQHPPRPAADGGPLYTPAQVDLQGLLGDSRCPIRSDRNPRQTLMREVSQAVGSLSQPEEPPDRADAGRAAYPLDAGQKSLSSDR